MKERVNLQMWVNPQFKRQVEEVARKHGFSRWQTLNEILLSRYIAGDIRLEPPKLKMANANNGGQHEPA